MSNEPRKLLYSPGYGAGWYSWNKGPMGSFMLTYQPIIEHLESVGLPVPQALLDQLTQDCKEKFGETPYLGGACELAVWTGVGQVKIGEYDGYESVITAGDVEWV